MVGIILIVLSIAVFAVFLSKKPEKIPEEKITSTGVVEQAHNTDGATWYVIRFTGERNRSYLAKTPGYIGETEKYEDGKLVHIRYWFGKKAPGAEILDEALTPVPRKWKGLPLLIGSILLLTAGVVLLILK